MSAFHFSMSGTCNKVKIAHSCPTPSPSQDTGVRSLSLLQGLFPTQGSNPGFPHCRQILYQLSHKGSPGALEWVPYPFSSRTSQPRNQTRVSCIAGGFLTSWAVREASHVINNVSLFLINGVRYNHWLKWWLPDLSFLKITFSIL